MIQGPLRAAALEAMAKLPAYQPALDSLITGAAKDVGAPSVIKEAGAVLDVAAEL